MTKKNSTDGSGQRLYKRAKAVIPGGTMLLSKRPEMFLPDQWPAYFERAKGCSVWDLDGRHFIDMSIMSVGTNLLGYGNEEVDAAVREVVSKGNMSTLNAPEEVYLAEKAYRFASLGSEGSLCKIWGRSKCSCSKDSAWLSGRAQVRRCCLWIPWVARLVFSGKFGGSR